MTTQIIKCGCKSDFQDKQYGPGNRLANGMRTGQFKCTVCGTVAGTKSVTQSEGVATKMAAKSEVKKDVPKDQKTTDAKNNKKKSLKGNKR